MARLLKLKLPEVSAVVVALDVPLSATVDPEPPVIVPERVKDCDCAVEVAAKFTPVIFAPFTVTVLLAGVNV